MDYWCGIVRQFIHCFFFVLFYTYPRVFGKTLLHELSQDRHPWREVWQQVHIRRPCVWKYQNTIISENWYFEVGETYICELRCCFAFVLEILEYCSPVWGSAAECHIQLAERQVYSVARLCPYHSFLSLCHDVVWLGLVCCTRLIRTLITGCASFHLPLLEFDILELRPQLIRWSLKYQVGKSQFARLFLPAQVRIWNDLPYAVFDTGTLEGFKAAVNRWLLPWVVFSSVLRGACVCGVVKAIY